MPDRSSPPSRTPLRVLIIGAGIAGAALAALLRRQGTEVTLIERGRADDPGGYMLGLLPLGGRVVDALGLGEAYRAASLPMAAYALYDRHGHLTRRFPLDDIVQTWGDWRGVTRGALLELLRGAAGEIRWQTTLAEAADTGRSVRATLSDGTALEVDLLVAADGIHSATRARMFGPGAARDYDTGWAGHVVWAGALPPVDTYHELWAAGWGVGLYPVPGRTGLFLAGRSEAVSGLSPEANAARIAARLPDGPFKAALAEIEPEAGGVLWKMADTRATHWVRGRSVLLGDAAAAFLPTAGVGASAALDSAAKLAALLDGAPPDGLDEALAAFEQQQRPRVEAMQDNSRALARWMFVDRPAAAFLRDVAMRFYTPARLMKEISAVMQPG